MNEKDRLQEISRENVYSAGLNAAVVEFTYKVLSSYFKGGSCLELGCAEGIGTKELARHFERVVAVDGAQIFINMINDRFRSNVVTGVCSLIEDFEIDETFDVVVLSHILEHVVDPVQVLSVAGRYLKDDGLVLIDVPHANSLHRLAAVRMGLLKTPDELNDTDRRNGHRRVYTRELMAGHIKEAGLEVVKYDGFWIKPLSNKQIEDTWDDAMVNAFLQLGRDIPEYCAEMVVVCRKA
jgi:2-polyprenyl-3-methyl-5-hydroxy-6-metoxy-1,4-benzoquinol methylase